MLKFLIKNLFCRAKYLFTLLLITLLFSGCFKNLTKLTTLYQNDFETFDMGPITAQGWNNGSFGPLPGVSIIKYNGSNVLGFFNNSVIDMNFKDLPKHDAINIVFDLYIHDEWKNDLWKYTIDGVDNLLTGFSNDNAIQQAYPDWLGNGSTEYPAQTDAYNNNLPGACLLSNSPHGTALYKMSITFLHNVSTFDFKCSDAGSSLGIVCNISWSIDNLKITLINN